MVFASPPVGGFLAIVTGIGGWRRSRHRALTRIGFWLGVVELVASIAIFITLIYTLGSAA